MASMASPKRMVSSVFITLAPPYRATVTQQQSAHNTAARDPQRAAARVGPGDDVHFTRPQRGDHVKAESHQGPDNKGRPGAGSSAKALRLQSAQAPEVGPNKGTPQRQNQGTGTCRKLNITTRVQHLKRTLLCVSYQIYVEVAIEVISSISW